MSETKNYKLYITDDGSERFLDWRKRLAGETESNMVKIDTAIAQKTDRSVVIGATLLASAWAGTPPTQEIHVAGLSATQNGVISVANSATPEQRETAWSAMLSVTGQESGKLMISADGTLPELDIPVSILISY